MLEVATFRKNKVDLADYDHSRDIASRVLMARFSPLDVQILQEILYSSLNIEVTALARTLSLEANMMLPVLQVLSRTGLFKIVGSQVQVDKERRKYFELQLMRFDEDYRPGIDFIQGLLKQVPIHVLPNWYAIPRTSNNILDSIVEKHLITPQLFHRYLGELGLSNPIERAIMEAVFKGPHFEISAAKFIKDHKLTQEQFEEHILYLELNFICTVHYKKNGNRLEEVVTPFFEWGQYLTTLHDSVPSPIEDQDQIKRAKASDFAFVEELSTLLLQAKKQPLALQRTSEDLLTLNDKVFKTLKRQCSELSMADLHHLVTKACQLGFADVIDDKLHLLDEGSDWLNLELKQRALKLLHHGSNSLRQEDLPAELLNERIVREAEKSIIRALDLGWIYLDDFFKSLVIPLNEQQQIQLKKTGRSWKYHLPHYSEEEIDLFKAVISERLFEVGVTALGSHNDRECFCVTPFGHDLFSNE